jgi:hypothetical protein
MSSISSYYGAPIAAAFLLAVFCKRVNEPVSENGNIFFMPEQEKQSSA